MQPLLLKALLKANRLFLLSSTSHIPASTGLFGSTGSIGRGLLGSLIVQPRFVYGVTRSLCIFTTDWFTLFGSWSSFHLLLSLGFCWFCACGSHQISGDGILLLIWEYLLLFWGPLTPRLHLPGRTTRTSHSHTPARLPPQPKTAIAAALEAAGVVAVVLGDGGGGRGSLLFDYILRSWGSVVLRGLLANGALFKFWCLGRRWFGVRVLREASQVRQGWGCLLWCLSLRQCRGLLRVLFGVLRWWEWCILVRTLTQLVQSTLFSPLRTTRQRACLLYVLLLSFRACPRYQTLLRLLILENIQWVAFHQLYFWFDGVINHYLYSVL